MMIAHTASKPSRLFSLSTHTPQHKKANLPFDPTLLKGPFAITPDVKRISVRCRTLFDPVGVSTSKKFQPTQYWSHSAGKDGDFYRVEVQLDTKVAFIQFFKAIWGPEKCIQIEP